jgi:hypothetical protein
MIEARTSFFFSHKKEYIHFLHKKGLVKHPRDVYTNTNMALM